MDLSHLVWPDFFGHSEELDLKVTDGSMAGHGGGDAVMAVSYTHLDVYKRQPLSSPSSRICCTGMPSSMACLTNSFTSLRCV